MVSRRNETLNSVPFQLGRGYTRQEIADIGEVSELQSTREWTGIVTFENYVLLFVTLEKATLAKEHSYDDYFDDELFFWESQNRNTQTTPHVPRMLEDVPVLLFCRIHNKIGKQGSPSSIAAGSWQRIIKTNAQN